MSTVLFHGDKIVNKSGIRGTFLENNWANRMFDTRSVLCIIGRYKHYVICRDVMTVKTI